MNATITQPNSVAVVIVPTAALVRAIFSAATAILITIHPLAQMPSIIPHAIMQAAVPPVAQVLNASSSRTARGIPRPTFARSAAPSCAPDVRVSHSARLPPTARGATVSVTFTFLQLLQMYLSLRWVIF